MKKYIVLTILVILVALIACQQKGAVEKAGERVDEVIDNVNHGDAPLKKKGTMEKIGESIDDSVKQDDNK